MSDNPTFLLIVNSDDDPRLSMFYDSAEAFMFEHSSLSSRVYFFGYATETIRIDRNRKRVRRYDLSDTIQAEINDRMKGENLTINITPPNDHHWQYFKRLAARYDRYIKSADYILVFNPDALTTELLKHRNPHAELKIM